MKRSHIPHILDRPWLPPLVVFSSLFLLLLLSLSLTAHTRTRFSSPGSRSTSIARSQSSDLPALPRFAYLISGTKGDGPRLTRLLQAVYHPRNCYLLHLDLESPDKERIELARYVKSESLLRGFGNVMVIGKADLVTQKGPTEIASMLHAIAILLKRPGDWDWFINLSASDYPLMPQDDLLHVFSYLPRDLNFLEHSSDIGWKEVQRARPIIIDPGLYHPKKSGVFYAKERRSLPVSFKLFMGSSCVLLTRTFLEFCIWGWDNLPRTLLMYYTNFLSSLEGYFHTVICNHKDYQNTTVNHDLHYIKWDSPPNQQPVTLTMEHFDEMVQSGALFGRNFNRDDPVLDRIDREVLKRPEGRFAPGGWCVASGRSDGDGCAVYGSRSVVKPTLSSKRLEGLLVKLLDPEMFRTKQCK
ncbi:hypothetical protein SAY86_005528 [Trapa natans]|uniref:Uncharacterized protein n=1 Tax=Trapa natans TaxID=22666 RepID=A0AAN7QUW3_TRANT|nr:hypothetical protein SAY86_005528 [Trapa natans]